MKTQTIMSEKDLIDFQISSLVTSNLMLRIKSPLEFASSTSFQVKAMLTMSHIYRLNYVNISLADFLSFL